MAIELNDTLQMMQALEKVKAPATFLVDTFFPIVPPTATSELIGVEYRKGTRKLAPFLTAGAGVAVERGTASINWYKPPMMAPMRIINDYDVMGRAFGEALLGSLTPEQRASQLQARDFVELQKMIMNRKNQMAAELLTTGKVTVKGYADDGQTVKTETITYDGWVNDMDTDWSVASANILDDLRTASDAIQEQAGEIPNIAICGRNVEQYLMSNNEIRQYLMIPSRENLLIANLQPYYVAPQIRFIGRISALNLDLYTYSESYIDENGTTKPFLGADDVIVGLAGKGKQLHGAVTVVDGVAKTMNTYAAPMVPVYRANETANTLSLTMYSRCILAPETVDDWYHLSVK